MSLPASIHVTEYRFATETVVMTTSPDGVAYSWWSTALKPKTARGLLTASVARFTFGSR